MTEEQAAHVLAMRGIRKAYNGQAVLKDVSLNAARGDVISIIGSSGSGKSTLLKCVNMLEVPDAGEVVIAGEAIALRPSHAGMVVGNRRQVDRMRSRIGMVFQNFNLWGHKTILENVIEAPIFVQGRPRRHCIDEAEHLLARVGIADKAGSYPAQLSGGQQQRAAIARALALRPELLLFDEPTSALDPELVGEVLRVMRSLAEEGRTMLVVTHEMAFAREVSTHVAFFNEGRIEVSGKPSEVFASGRSERLDKFLQPSSNYKGT